MYTAEDFQKAIEDYAAFNHKLMSDISFARGLLKVLSIGPGPENEPEHEEFCEEIRSGVKAVSAQNPDPETALQIIQVIFRARITYSDEKIPEYIFSVIEGSTLDLIPFISKEDSASLYDWYRKNTPWKNRTPLQNKVLKALKDRSASFTD